MKFRLLNLILIICFFITCNVAISQNLIPNAGFEYHRNCPTVYGQVSLATGWRNPTKGTPDYYHSCSIEDDYKTPKNRYGKKIPYDGEAYMGLNNRNSYREYIRIRLKEPLKKGEIYKTKVYVSSSNDFDYIISDIGFYFSIENTPENNNRRIRSVIPQVVNHQDSLINTDKWQEISGEFIAEGGEKFVTIGSFNQSLKWLCINEKLDTKKNPYHVKNSYIYIDNLSTVPLKRPKYKLPAKGKVKMLDFVYFRFDKAALLSASFEELNKLVEILKNSNSIKVEIIGHTDNTGDEEHNLELSEQRALAVANYLVQKGIAKDRVKYKGLGSTSPIGSNETIKDRQLNRRVEFRVID